LRAYVIKQETELRVDNERTVTEPGLSDEAAIRRVLQGERNAYEVIMRRYNQRLFRIARSYIRDEDEIEDVVQETYIKAYEQLHRFEFRSRFSTWLTRILMNEALARARRQQRFSPLAPDGQDDPGAERRQHALAPEKETPMERLMNAELKEILEKAVDDLPEKYRLVYMMREVEGMSVAETSECLAITQTNVKVRVNRAKEMLRGTISGFYQQEEVFEFNLVRCDRIVKGVLERIGAR